MKRKRITPAEEDISEDAERNSDNAVPETSRKELKAKVHSINAELAELARKKHLKQALKTFAVYSSKGLPLDVHAYSSILNAYVRCGDLSGALMWINKMQVDNIPANIVSYTTLLKGCCEAGLLQSASDIFFNSILSVSPKMYRILSEEESPKASNTQLANVNVRALNAFLRGCTRVGAVTAALNAYYFYTAAESATRPYPDTTSFELIIGLLCRAGHLSTAYSMLENFASTVDPVSQPELVIGSSTSSGQGGAAPADPLENAAIYLSLAQACALRGLVKESAKWITLTENALHKSNSAGLKNAMLQRFQQQISASPGPTPTSDRTRRSVKLFLEHREDEIRHRLHLLEDYLAARMNPTHNLTLIKAGSRGSPFLSTAAANLLSRLMHIQAQVLDYLSHVLYFGTDGNGDFDLTLPQTKSAAERKKAVKQIESKAQMSCIAGRLVVALKDKCGLKIFTPQELAEVVGVGDLPIEALKEYKSCLQSVVHTTIEKVFRSISPETGHIDLFSLFDIKDINSKESPVEETEVFVDPSGYGLTAEEYGLLCGEVVVPQTSAAPEPKQRLPDMNLEIGSGDGEWITAQANASIHTDKKTGQQVINSYWLAMELRHDRVCNTVTHYLSSLPPTPPPPSPHSSSHNLAILGGDAMKIISDRLADACVSAIFINHPQPPEKILEVKAKGRLSSQGKHLLTEEFFSSAYRILRYPQGRVTIVTDSLQYAQLLAQTLVEQVRSACGFFVSAPLRETVDRLLEERRPIALDNSGEESESGSSSSSSRSNRSGSLCVEIWRGEPGAECGHVEDASSYFDRMWNKGKKKKRWILFLRPVSTEDI